MRSFTFRTEELTRLLAGREQCADEISERLRWFLHFAQCGSVCKTCLAFGIPRTTFYRWAQRYSPDDLTTLENRSTIPAVRRRCVRDQGGGAIDRSALIHRPVESVTTTKEIRSGPSPMRAESMESRSMNSHGGYAHRTCLLCRLRHYDWARWKRALFMASVVANLALIGFFLSTIALESHRSVAHSLSADLSTSIAGETASPPSRP